jgi:hypothetical protein
VIRVNKEFKEFREFREYSESVGRIYYFLPIFPNLLNFLNLLKFYDLPFLIKSPSLLLYSKIYIIFVGLDSIEL